MVVADSIGRGPRDAPPPLGPNTFLFMQFLAQSRQIVGTSPLLSWLSPKKAWIHQEIS